MKRNHRIAATAVALSVMSLWAQAAGVKVGKQDLGGVVTGPSGPEAGVWVIAETKDLPTKFAKVVVTDDKGRYLLPEMPSAEYQVWVRGYGLVDSVKVAARPGWQDVPAVRHGQLFEIKSADILQPGPAALTDGVAQLHRIFCDWAQQHA